MSGSRILVRQTIWSLILAIACNGDSVLCCSPFPKGTPLGEVSYCIRHKDAYSMTSVIILSKVLLNIIGFTLSRQNQLPVYKSGKKI